MTQLATRYHNARQSRQSRQEVSNSFSTISLVSENSNEFLVCSGDSFPYFVLRWHAQ